MPSLWEYEENQNSKADDIDQLTHHYPHLHFACIDNIRINRAVFSTF